MKGPVSLLPVFIFAICPSLAGQQNGFELIMPDIYRLENACNVCLLRSGPACILYILTADVEDGHEFFGEYPLGYIVINE